ncbi:hypothetical protein ACQPW3_05720 [Actinosynnema sp. CA-248983]
MLVIRGVNVFPAEIEAVLLADERVSPHYLIVEDHRARPELWVVVEARAEGVWEELTEALRERLRLTCKVVVVREGTVPRTETGMARRLVRWTDGEPPVPGLIPPAS